MKTEELRELHAQLPESECLAIDETIMDRGICTFDELMKTFDVITTYFNERPNAKLSFKAFQASKRAVTWGLAESNSNGLDGPTAEMLVYEDGCFIICLSDGRFQLIIECSEWLSNDLESLEQLLYDRWHF